MPKLSDVAKHVAVPDGVVSTAWPAVEAKCADLGIRFRPWQPGVGRLILAKRADGRYAATIGGTGLSIPRQTGKTFLVGAIVFALCLLNPGLTVIWTAHRVRTAEETFGKMQAFARRARIKPFVDKVVLGSGEEAILFRNGARILFGAREGGFGLGFDEVDVLIFDEAQRLRDITLDDMVPATNQSRQPGGALLLFMGTPPRPTDPGEVFTRMRDDALTSRDPDTGWVEFGADDGFEPTPLPESLTADDWAEIEKANPSYPQDTPREAILRMRKKLGPESFVREALGIWDSDGDVERVVTVEQWAARTITVPFDDWPLAAVGLDMDMTGRVWVSVAAHADDSGVHVELLPDDLLAGGADAAVRWVRSRCRRRLPVVMPADSGATVLRAPLLAAGVKVYPLNVPEQRDASAGLVQHMVDGSLTHLDDPALAGCVAESEREVLNRVRGWRIKRVGETSSAPLWAAACASYGAVKWSKRRATVESGSRGEVVVL